MTSPDVWAYLAQIPLSHVAIVVATATGLVGVVVKVWPAIRRTVHLIDDLAGEPERPGVPARPGVMERLQDLETSLDEVKHEVTTNDGTSLKDATRRTERQVQKITKRVEELAARIPPNE